MRAGVRSVCLCIPLWRMLQCWQAESNLACESKACISSWLFLHRPNPIHPCLFFVCQDPKKTNHLGADFAGLATKAVLSGFFFPFNKWPFSSTMYFVVCGLILHCSESGSWASVDIREEEEKIQHVNREILLGFPERLLLLLLLLWKRMRILQLYLDSSELPSCTDDERQKCRRADLRRMYLTSSRWVQVALRFLLLRTMMVSLPWKLQQSARFSIYIKPHSFIINGRKRVAV